MPVVNLSGICRDAVLYRVVEGKKKKKKKERKKEKTGHESSSPIINSPPVFILHRPRDIILLRAQPSRSNAVSLYRDGPLDMPTAVTPSSRVLSHARVQIPTMRRTVSILRDMEAKRRVRVRRTIRPVERVRGLFVGLGRRRRRRRRHKVVFVHPGSTTGCI